MKFKPAHMGSVPVPRVDALDNAQFCCALLGILMLRNEGKPLTFTQTEFDVIAGMQVLEGRNQRGDFMIALAVPLDSAMKHTRQ